MLPISLFSRPSQAAVNLPPSDTKHHEQERGEDENMQPALVTVDTPITVTLVTVITQNGLMWLASIICRAVCGVFLVIFIPLCSGYVKKNMMNV